jgi:ketosteroid isomerase-like protein
LQSVSQENIDVVHRGYRAFLAGDFETLASLLDENVEWVGMPSPQGEATSRDMVLAVLAERLEGLPRVALERCIAAGDRVVVYFRASREQRDTTDERPLQTRRFFTVGRYAGVITIRDGRVTRIEDHPHVNAALEAVGLAGEFT